MSKNSSVAYMIKAQECYRAENNTMGDFWMALSRAAKRREDSQAPFPKPEQPTVSNIKAA